MFLSLSTFFSLSVSFFFRYPSFFFAESTPLNQSDFNLEISEGREIDFPLILLDGEAGCQLDLSAKQGA